MSAFKQLLQQDAYVSTYIAKKSFNLSGGSLPNNSIFAFPWELYPCDLILECQYVLDPSPTPTISTTPTISISVTPTISITNTPSKTPRSTRSITPTISVSPSISISPSTTKTPSITRTTSTTPSVTFTPSTTLTPTNTITPSITQTPKPDIITDGLYFRFDGGWPSNFNNTTDTWTDLTYNGFDAIRTGSSRVSYNESNFGFDFTGVTDTTEDGIYIKNLNYISGFSDPIPNLTIESWIKPNSITTGHTNDERIILSFDNSSVLRFGIGFDGDGTAAGKPHFSFTNSDGRYDIVGESHYGGLDLRDNQWHQLVVTFSSTSVKFYLNSVLIHTTTGNFAPIGGQYDIETPRYGWIGNGSEADSEGGTITPGNMFYGTISIINYYYKTLSDAEVAYNFNSLASRYGIVAITPSPTQTPSNTPTQTYTPTVTFTPSVTYTPTVTFTPTSTQTPTNTYTPTVTFTPTNTQTPSQTYTPTNTQTPSQTYTPTVTFTPTNTQTPTNTYTPTVTFTPTNTQTPTITPSILPDIELGPILRLDSTYPDIFTGGVWRDQSGNNYDAVPTGFGVSYNSSTTPYSFVFSNANLNTTDGIYIKELNYTTGASDTIESLTIETWFKAYSSATNPANRTQCLVSFDRTSVYQLDLTSGKPRFLYADTDGTAVEIAPSYLPNLRDNKWHQVVVTFTTYGAAMYIDGDLVYEDTEDYLPITYHTDSETPSYGWIGQSSNARTEGGSPSTDGHVFYGEIGAVNIYSYALSKYQVQKNFQGLRNYFGVDFPTPSATRTATPSVTNSPTPTQTYTPTVTFTPSVTYTPTVTFTPTNTQTPTNTYTPTVTFTPTNTQTPSQTYTPSVTITPTTTLTPTPTITITPSVFPVIVDPPTIRLDANYPDSVRQNLALQSSQFDTSPWSVSGGNLTITANVETAPDGTTTADRLNTNTTTAQHYVYQGSMLTTISENYTFSVYVKAGTLSQVRVVWYDSLAPNYTNRGRVDVDLVSGTSISSYIGIFSIEEVGTDGWYRIYVAGTAGHTISSLSIRPMKNGQVTYAGSTSEYIYAWGAQFEKGTIATDYISTAASTGIIWEDLSYSNYDAQLITTSSLITYEGTGAIKYFQFGPGASSIYSGIGIKDLNYITGGTDELYGLTIEAWVRAWGGNTGRTGDERIILSFDRSANFKFSLGNANYGTPADTAGKLGFSWTSTNAGGINSTTRDDYASTGYTDLRDNSWHQVVVTFSTYAVTYYVDGDKIHTTTPEDFGLTEFTPITNHIDTETPRYGWIGNGSEASAELQTGTGISPSYMWSGSIGALNYYEYALDQWQIKGNFDGMKNYYSVSDPTPSATPTSTPTPSLTFTPTPTPTRTCFQRNEAYWRGTSLATLATAISGGAGSYYALYICMDSASPETATRAYTQVSPCNCTVNYAGTYYISFANTSTLYYIIYNGFLSGPFPR